MKRNLILIAIVIVFLAIYGTGAAISAKKLTEIEMQLRSVKTFLIE